MFLFVNRYEPLTRLTHLGCAVGTWIHSFPTALVYFSKSLIWQQWNPPAAKLHGILLYGTPIQPLASRPSGTFLLPLITWLYGTVEGNVAIPWPLTPVTEDKGKSNGNLWERKLKGREGKGPKAGQEKSTLFELNVEKTKGNLKVEWSLMQNMPTRFWQSFHWGGLISLNKLFYCFD